ncbi:MAG: hypothetical protein P8177_14650 [Gemmatimonadota bacterium]
MNVPSLWAELKRRHVLQVTGAYLVAGWVVIEVASTVLPELNAPEWSMRALIGAVAALVPVVIVVSWVFDLTRTGIVRTDEVPLPPVRDPGPSVAVLPFANLSPDPDNEYFSDGITEDIIARLSSIEGVRVISRTSVMRYRNTDRTVRQIGRELGVKTVLEGSVRRADNRVRIVAQLIDARYDSHLWSEGYDRELEDIFAIQTDVAHRIAGALETRIAGTVPRPERETSVKAYELYLKGRYAWNQRTPASLQRGVELLEASIEADPTYALAHAALADAYLTLSYGIAAPSDVMPRAEAAASRALELDPSLAEGWSARATVRALYRWDWDASESEFERAIELNPQYSTARSWLALNCLAPQGRFDAARTQLEAARRVDPLAPVIGTCVGILSFFERSYERAVSELSAVLESDLDTLEARTAAGYVSPVHLAQVRIGLGETGPALDRLEDAVEARASELAWLAVRPVFDPLRGEPRFRALLEAVGLDAP